LSVSPVRLSISYGCSLSRTRLASGAPWFPSLSAMGPLPHSTTEYVPPWNGAMSQHLLPKGKIQGGLTYAWPILIRLNFRYPFPSCCRPMCCRCPCRSCRPGYPMGLLLICPCLCLWFRSHSGHPSDCLKCRCLSDHPSDCRCSAGPDSSCLLRGRPSLRRSTPPSGRSRAPR
jgi:hypothetical protein